ncbi:MAG TPA: AAA family ATPase [Bacteroidales bacterium]|nr:AAA family ATPase [Bacteroidales bacterium]
MERKVFSELRVWSGRTRRKPLLLRGARQVGKTWLVDKLANEDFNNYIKIDFEENPGFKNLFEGDINPHKICTELELMLGIDIQPGKSLLFFDEVQLCPRAIISLRYFYEKMADLHVIAAGSLLEFALSEISFPVGRIQILEIHPMVFSEFLDANGYEEASKICNNRVEQLSASVHDFLIQQLRIYWIVGGMPESIKVYRESKSIKQAIEVQDEIIETYQLDFVKYKPKTDFNCLKSVFSGIASNVGHQVKYTGLARDYSIPTIRKAYESLLMARLAKKIRAVSAPGNPIEVFASEKKFKNIFLDIGLMNRIINLDYSEALSHKNLLAIYRGQLAEQFVGQEFAAASNSNLYYWARDAKSSNAEIDYLAQFDNEFVPVEVKDGPSGKLRSLHLYRNTYEPKCAVVFNSGKMGSIEKENLIFLPLYFAGSFAKFGAGQ